MQAMRYWQPVRRWCAGWIELTRHGEPVGYHERGWLARLRLDAGWVAAALANPGFWGAGLVCVALGLAAQILVWRFDLGGWRRDGLQCLPALLAAPWVAGARRRYLEARFVATPCQAATAITDQCADPLHSAAVVAAERERWCSLQAAWWTRAGPPRAGWLSSWRWPAWARWRSWRCRASSR